VARAEGAVLDYEVEIKYCGHLSSELEKNGRSRLGSLTLDSSIYYGFAYI
jgi:hypothetical protein